MFLLIKLKTMKYFIPIILIILLSNCQDTSNNKYDEAKTIEWNNFEVVKLKGKKFHLDTLMQPTKMYFHNKMLYLIDTHLKKTVHIYDVDSKKKIGSFFPQGRGPNEVIGSPHISFHSNNLFILDISRHIFRKYELNFINNNLNIIRKRRINLKGRLKTHCYQINNNKIISLNRSAANIFTIHDNKGKIISKNGKYPTSSQDVQENLLPFAYKSKMGMTPDRSKVLLAYYLTDLLEIYDPEGNLLNRIHGPDQFLPKYKDRSNNNITSIAYIKGKTRIAHKNIAITDKRIFTLYDGNYKKKGVQHTNKILSFDHNGTPSKSYKLDIPIVSFAVNSDKHIIYGLTYNKEPKVIYFQY